jgi:integrase
MTTAASCLPVSAWPEADQAAWRCACRRGSLLDDSTPAATWRKATRRGVEKSYGRWLQWLSDNDPLALRLAPADRMTPERVARYLADRQSVNASSTVHLRILHLSRMVAVMTGAPAPPWLREVVARLERAIEPARDDRARLVPAATLLELGLRLMARAEAGEGLPWQNALLYRDGLMIAIQSVAWPRVGNLAMIRVGKHLQRRGDQWWLTFEADEMKGGRPHELPLPVELTPAIDRCLGTWRPLLLARRARQKKPPHPEADRLWLGCYGAPLPAKDLNAIINRVTRRELGRAVNPHLFRKLVPTELAIHDPAHVGIAQRLLGHASYRTTEDAYNLASSLEAARRYQGALAALRAATRAKPAPTKRRPSDQ